MLAFTSTGPKAPWDLHPDAGCLLVTEKAQSLQEPLAELEGQGFWISGEEEVSFRLQGRWM